ncbi:MAG: hypothetical protein RQ733_10070 [Methyloprofundus sp.]|nr:hypothetical protein [Methyloprofundus sp.]MDT8426307.1 hypothetical protein [Methyloprofundus sp.]
MQLNNASIESHIPYYLTQEAKNGLIQALKDFPQKTNYYTDLYPGEVLQGDGFGALDVIRFKDGSKRSIKGILLSNSCDMDINNKRELPLKITFAPLIKLDNYILLLEKNIDQERLQSKINTIKEQKVTNLFYLPKNKILVDDHIAIFSDLHTIPLSALNNIERSNKLFTLSQVGFYLFLFKLSIHFCRFHENVER